jgi:hypothetical protein
MMTRDEALLFGGILTSLKKRLEGAKRDLARAKRWSFGGDQITGAELDRAHHEGRIAELESVITELKNQYWEDLEHPND